MTLGLVGLGHVGRDVAVRATALGCTVLAHDPAPPRIVPAGVSLVGFDDLLGRSDIVSVHARASRATGTCSAPQRSRGCARGSYFINTARETLVDEDALQAALVSGRWRARRWTWLSGARAAAVIRCSTCLT